MARGQEYFVGTPEKPYDTSGNVSWVDLVVGILWTKIYGNDPVKWQAKAIKFDLVIIGEIYCGSDEVGGMTWHGEDPQQLWNLYTKHGDDANAAIKDLLGMECDPVIYGIVIREI